MNNTYSKFFRSALRAEVAADQKYEADQRDWYENGDGQDPNWVTEVDGDGNAHTWNEGGRGYRYPYCQHGMSRWTDYDNICGGCEDSLSPIQRAQGVARSEHHAFMARINWVVAAPVDLPQETRLQLIQWASESLPPE